MFHIQAVFGTDVYAAAALHAVKAVDRPCAGIAVYLDGAGRTVLGAQRTADALADVDADMSAHALGIDGRFIRVVDRGRPGDHVFQRLSGKGEQSDLSHHVTSLYS